MAFKSYRDESKVNWDATVEEGTNLNREQLQLGCLLRIADSTEAMAKNHTRLIDDNEWYKKRNKELEERVQFKNRSIAALKGVITKLKKKLK